MQREKRNVFSDKMLSPVEAAYVAAMIDGEGTLSIWPTKSSYRRNYTLTSHLSIAGTDRQHIERVIEMMGNGRLDVEPKSNPKHKCLYRAQLVATQIRCVLPQIRPYLQLKTRQADLILEYFTLQDRGRLAGQNGVSDADWPRAVAIYEEMRGLNQRGQRKEDIEFLIRDRKSVEIRPCIVEGCASKSYRSQQWCYQHWLEFGDHAERECEECGESFKAARDDKRFCSKACGNRNFLKRKWDGPKGQHRKLTEETVRAIVDAFKAGNRSMRELGREFGTDAANVKSILSGTTWAHLKLDLPDPCLLSDVTGARHWTAKKPHPQRGAGHSRAGAKLTVEQVQDIRSRYKAGGVTQKALSQEFGVCLQTVSDICTGRRWAHV